MRPKRYDTDYRGYWAPSENGAWCRWEEVSLLCVQLMKLEAEKKELAPTGLTVDEFMFTGPLPGEEKKLKEKSLAETETLGKELSAMTAQRDRLLERLESARFSIEELVTERNQLKDLRAEVERLRVQLAGCATAAASSYNPATPDMWGWSPAYQDVLNLRTKYEVGRRQAKVEFVREVRKRAHEMYEGQHDSETILPHQYKTESEFLLPAFNEIVKERGLEATQ